MVRSNAGGIHASPHLRIALVSNAHMCVYVDFLLLLCSHIHARVITNAHTVYPNLYMDI